MMSCGTLNGALKRTGEARKELALLVILLSNPNISLSEEEDRMGISKRTVSRIIASLQGKGIAERQGSKKSGRWKVVK